MYLIYSNDRFLLTKQLNKLIKKYSNDSEELTIHHYSWIDDDLNKIYEDINTISLFGEPKMIIINDCLLLTDQVLDDKKYPNKKHKELMLKILTSNNNRSIVVFMVQTNRLSTKNKLAKAFEKDCQVIAIPELNEQEFGTYIEHQLQLTGKVIDAKNLEYFLELVPRDLVVINNELEKLKALSIKNIERQTLDRNISKYREVDIFKIADAFINNQPKELINQLNSYFNLNNDFISLIYLLTNELVFTRDCFLLYYQHKNQPEIAKLLNAHPYRVKMVFKKNKRLDISALNDKILVLYDLNSLLVQGSINPEVIAKLELIKVIERES